MSETHLRLIAPMALLASFTIPGATARVETNSVDAVSKSILVTVLDEAGQPLRDLAARDFIVIEDGERREVIDAQPNYEPLFVALLVDTAKPVPGVQFPTQDLRRGLAAFSRGALAGGLGSQMAIVDVAMGGTVVVPFTSELKPLTAWISRVVASQQGGSVLLEALMDVSRQLMSKPSPRRAIVSVTFDAPEGSTVPPQTVADAVIRSGAAYWPVSIRGVGRSAPPVPLRETLFSVLPDPTGGLQVTAVSTRALESILGRVAAALTSQYEVTYARPEGVSPKVIQASARRGAKVLRASWIR